MAKKRFFLLFFIMLSFTLWGYYTYSNNNKIEFHNITGDKISILVNGYELIPPYDKNIDEYNLVQLSSVKKNIISVQGIEKIFKVPEISLFNTMNVSINSHQITLNLMPEEYPLIILTQYGKMENKSYLITPFHNKAQKPSCAYMVNEMGKIIFYHCSTNQVISNFKQTILPNGEKYYSFFKQEKKMPPFHYLLGHFYVLDDDFNLIKKMKIKKTDKHPELMIENHDSLILDKNHFVLSSYFTQEIYHPITEDPISISSIVIQEIKDDTVVFDWVSSDYDTLFNEPLFYYHNDKFGIDYLHFNSIIIDKKDNNFILSFATPSCLVKIDRKTGNIIWKLGGLFDEFGLDENQQFFGQHSLSFTQDGYLMLFDNQSSSFSHRIYKKPISPVSRILKFKLDEKNKKVIDFIKYDLTYTTTTMGSVYETGNNCFILANGTHATNEKLCLNNKKLVQKLKLEQHNGMHTYRAYEIDSIK